LTTLKPAFHDTDIDTDTDSPRHAYILTSDTRDFLKLFLRQAERASRPTRLAGEDVGVGVVECGLNCDNRLARVLKKVPERSTFIFSGIPEFLYNTA